ncbi:maleylpyruvate isomerase [Herbihabitans rhizosphaerae]|uniref:Maleylpyruvate isomerase n=1 Tax=Herbihabitans rhizosphaerae TaxID=1872711 RepID=A0A4V2ERE6_9PSEU|nr:maleylpyruvate isomerase family mycothiol-dependent enzyme [Herbihabitans rhizosphaerae]RZS30582.1 maleylpyruvate isomerase [Herbihabitans rhizosphaerae]
MAEHQSVADAVRKSHARLSTVLGGLDDGAARGPSLLPGWSRGHVLTHIQDVARAFARQAEYARAGELVEVYDGGRPARDASIEAGAGRPAAELATAVTEAIGELERVWDGLDGEDWSRPVRYRHGTVLDTVYAQWREVEIHTVDLALDYSHTEWTPEFCAHTLDFLAPRAPAGVTLRLEPEDSARTRAWGSGPTVTVRGRLTEITAWLAGRPADGVSSDTGTPPELGPWPPHPSPR